MKDFEVELLDKFTLNWYRNGIGFGQIYFYEKNGKLHCESEGMGKQFVKEVLAQMVDDTILDD